MKLIDILVLAFLLVVLSIGLYVLWDNLPGKIQEFQSGNVEGKVSQVYSNGTQFYQNMRYPDKRISYSIASACDSKRRQSIITAFSIISNETILSFYPVQSSGEIQILCSDIAPDPQDSGHFVAGEGGPRDIYISGPYHVITSGRVALYRDDKCNEPKIAIHEILHALGFDHNNNPRSIMYPITSCDENIDQYIIDEIDWLYMIASAPDLVITSASAEKSGKYLSFQVAIANYGLIDADGVNMSLYAGNQKIKDFEFRDIPLGNKKEIKVSNLQIPRNAETILFEAYLTSNQSEISLDNNKIELNVVK